MKDYGMLLEKTIEAYWGQPKTTISFANYYGDDFKMKAILFSLVVTQINYRSEEYPEEELKQLEDYESKFWSSTPEFSDDINVLKLLAKHKNLLIADL
ncbi:MAG TPA: hypothetical protein DCR40_17950 [Prolixibacteraceae bacterium]|nr:hypothetical protein [Prolixibacteraceae bacterium]